MQPCTYYIITSVRLFIVPTCLLKDSPFICGSLLLLTYRLQAQKRIFFGIRHLQLRFTRQTLSTRRKLLQQYLGVLQVQSYRIVTAHYLHRHMFSKLPKVSTDRPFKISNARS
jgi:hypothetical protein